MTFCCKKQTFKVPLEASSLKAMVKHKNLTHIIISKEMFVPYKLITNILRDKNNDNKNQ